DGARARLGAPRATAELSSGRQDRPVVVEKLSEREREVLQHVSEMLNTTEIAAVMYVSGNTVKSHLKSVFRKLGVASRNEAVPRPGELERLWAAVRVGSGRLTRCSAKPRSRSSRP